MRFLKISLITIGCLVALFIAAAVILPRIYKDDLLAIIREEANQNLTATLDFKDLDLSLFRQFPRLSVRLDSLSITGRDVFDGYTLLSCDRAEISVSIWDLFQQDAPLRIQTLDLDHPDFRILILENGQANYDITVPDTMQQEEPETPGLTGAIQAYSITDGSIRYEDRTMPLVFSLAGLQHNGKGDFTQSRFTLQTQTTAEAMDMDYDGTAYFTRVRTRMEADLEIDLDKMRFGFGNNHLTLNDLELIGEGAIEMPNEDILIDLALHTPQSDLKHVWSIIPGAFTADYQDLQSSGTFTLEAWMKGIYNETSFPSFAFHTLLQKGLVKYPSLSFPIQDIDAEIHLEQPGSSLDAVSINIPNFQLSIKDQGIKGRFAATEIMTDPKVDAAVKGKIDLGLLKQAFPLEAATLSGQIAMDVGIKAQMSDLDAGRVDQVDLHGSASINNLTYKSEGQPAISVAQGNVIFSPQAVQATGFVIQAGKSDLALDARIDNILAVIHPERTLKGNIRLTSHLLDLDEWQSESAETEGPAASAAPASADNTLPVEQFDLQVDASVDRVLVNQMEINQFKIKGQAGPTAIQIGQLAGQIGESDFSLSGHLENLLGWISGTDMLRGNIQMVSRKFNLNQFMDQEEVAAAPADAPFAPVAIPAQVHLTGEARIDHLIYTDLDLRQVTAQLDIANEEARLSRFEAAGLGGKLALQGAYNTQNIAKPAFHLKYDLQKLDFQQVFNKFNSFQALAPIGKYIQGNFSSNMVMDGILGQDMMPDLSTLEAAGFLETFNSFINGFKPVEGLAEKLNVKELKSLDLKGTKNWFEVKNGVLELKDFDYSFKDIAMTIGGSHGLNQDMSYHVKARIPRSMMEKNAVTASANTGLKWLESEATKKGLNVSVGSHVNVLVKIGGNISAPTYQVQLLGSDGEASAGDMVRDQAGELTRQVRDSLERLGKGKIDEAKLEAKRQAQARLDSLKKVANRTIDTTLAKAKNEAVKKAEEALGKEVGKKIEEIGGDKAKEETDKIKEKLKNWDPLGKKKKDGQE